MTQLEPQPDYFSLTPDLVLDALESIGLFPEAALLTLNSYENRVFQYRDQEGKRWVTKFYRPNRWSNEQIIEEHQFSLELLENEIPVVPPETVNNATLHFYKDFRFSIFESKGGRTPNLDDEQVLKMLGRMVARIHNLGSVKRFEFRPEITLQDYGISSVEFLQNSNFIPFHLEQAFAAITEQLLEVCNQAFEKFGSYQRIRIHCDCHPGNLLWNDDAPSFVDFDDSRMGPAIQDLWMLITDPESELQKIALVSGYQEFRELDPMQWNLVESLRTLRMLHYSAWLGRRWEDPAFKHHFPWFESNGYWEQQILSFKEQFALIKNN
jgi:Ser/Thr protein kinase RdoA (MazF antagonist)